MLEIQILHTLLLAHNEMTGEHGFDKTYEELFEEVAPNFLKEPVTIEEVVLGTLAQMSDMMNIPLDNEDKARIGASLLSDLYAPFGGQPRDLVVYCPFPAEVLAMYILDDEKDKEMSNMIVS